MSIIKLESGTFVNHAPVDPDTVTGRKPIKIGTRQVKDINVGEFVLASNGSWNKVTGITPTTDTAVKTVVLATGATITISNSDDVNVADNISTEGGTVNVIETNTLEDNSTVYALTVEGSNNFLASGFIIG